MRRRVATRAAGSDLVLRDVVEDDLPVFFENQLDPEANHMAAFTSKDPTDREAFDAHWERILGDGTVIIRTVVLDGDVAGSVLSYEESGRPEVSYWIGKSVLGPRCRHAGTGGVPRACGHQASHQRPRCEGQRRIDPSP